MTPIERPQTTRKLVPQGAHLGRCCSIVDLGTGPETWEGKTTQKRMLNITFELPGIQIEIDGEKKPMTVGRKYAASEHEKSALIILRDNWLGKPKPKYNTEGEPLPLPNWSPDELLGKEGSVNVQHWEKKDGTTAHKIASVTMLISGSPPVPEGGELWVYEPEFPEKNWDKLLPWMRERVATSYEYRKARRENSSSKDLDETDNVPF